MNADGYHEYTYQDWPKVPCRVESHRTGRWVEVWLTVDTGADATILDSDVAIELGVPLAGPPRAIVGFGGRLEGHFAVVDLIPLAQAELRAPLDVAFAAGIEGRLGGVLGLDYLAQFDLFLSHANNRLGLRPA